MQLDKTYHYVLIAHNKAVLFKVLLHHLFRLLSKAMTIDPDGNYNPAANLSV